MTDPIVTIPALVALIVNAAVEVAKLFYKRRTVRHNRRASDNAHSVTPGGKKG